MLNHKLDMNRISALHNVIEDGMAAGLGLDDDMSLHLTVRGLRAKMLLVAGSSRLRVEPNAARHPPVQPLTAPSNKTASEFWWCWRSTMVDEKQRSPRHRSDGSPLVRRSGVD